MRVRIEAPSSPFSRDKLDAGVARLRAAGLTVDPPAAPRGTHAYLNGSDDERRASLREALDSGADVVWLARGGYGLTRILDAPAPFHRGIPRDAVHAMPKATVGAPADPSLITGAREVAGRHFHRGPPRDAAVHAVGADPSGAREVGEFMPGTTLVGFSDATALFAALLPYGTRCVHGPLATTLADEPDASFRHCLDVIAGRAPAPLPLSVDGAIDVEGWLFAGNLCVLAALCGTPAQPNLAGAIVVLEEVGERPYRIDRMLTQLLQAGVLDDARAVVVGHLTGCEEPAGRGVPGRAPSPAPLHVFRERLAHLPLAHGLAAGHQAPNLALPIGAPARLRGAGAAAQLEIAAR